MTTVRVSSKGQIAIPKAIRERFGLKQGSELAVDVEGERVVMRKVSRKTWRRWQGSLEGADALRQHEEEHRLALRRDEEGS